MHVEARNQYVAVAKPFVLKGSHTERFLVNLRTRRRYALDEEQSALLELCDGTRRVQKILAEYDSDSQAVVEEYFDKLVEVQAVAFTDVPAPREFRPSVADPQLQSVHFEFTSRCNMRCLHCYQASYLCRRDDLTFDEIALLAKAFGDLNVDNVGLSGGEPFERDDLFEVIQAIEEQEISVSSILTNGLRLNDRALDRLLKCQSQFSLFVSLDGMRPSAMSIRGFTPHRHEKVFDRLVGNIRSAISAGVSVMINTVVTRENLADLPAMYHWLREMGVEGWRIALPKVVGAYRGNIVKLGLDRSEVFRSYQRVIETHLVSGGVESGFRLQIEHFFRLEVFKNLTPLPPDAFVCDYETKRQSLCVKPNGDVTPCPLYLDLVMGNVRERSLAEIWYSPEMRRIKDIRICEVKGCASCRLAPLCATGCRANAIFLRGSIDAVDDDACAATQFFLTEVAPLLRLRGIDVPALQQLG